ncbi:MAG: hypothetical protein Q4C04_04680 [Clostridia bacterium]|nr:hypothetical protein [Clostridia bacterium]
MTKTKRVFRMLAMIFANALLVIGGVYILFTILDHFNPLLHFISDDFFLTVYIEEVLIGLGIALGVCSIVALWRRRRPK